MEIFRENSKPPKPYFLNHLKIRPCCTSLNYLGSGSSGCNGQKSGNGKERIPCGRHQSLRIKGLRVTRAASVEAEKRDELGRDDRRPQVSRQNQAHQ